MMTIQSKPFSDKEELLPACYRCSNTNPLVTSTNIGDVCIDCGHPFIRSFASFDCLPLVQFFPAEGITDEQAVAFINDETASAGRRKAPRGGRDGPDDKWRETEYEGDVQTMTFGNDDADGRGGANGASGAGGGDGGGMGGGRDGGMGGGDGRGAGEGKGGDEDLFSELLNNMDSTGSADSLIVCNARVLRSLHPTEVFVQKFPRKCERFRFFKNMIPDVPVSLCAVCNKFFHQEDFEFSVLQKGHCPFCRSTADKVGLS